MAGRGTDSCDNLTILGEVKRWPCFVVLWVYSQLVETRDVCAILQESVLILGRLGKQRLENRRASLGNLSSGWSSHCDSRLEFVMKNIGIKTDIVRGACFQCEAAWSMSLKSTLGIRLCWGRPDAASTKGWKFLSWILVENALIKCHKTRFCARIIRKWTKYPDIWINIKAAVLVFGESKGSQLDARASMVVNKSAHCVQVCRDCKSRARTSSVIR